MTTASSPPTLVPISHASGTAGTPGSIVSAIVFLLEVSLARSLSPTASGQPQITPRRPAFEGDYTPMRVCAGNSMRVRSSREAGGDC